MDANTPVRHNKFIKFRSIYCILTAVCILAFSACAYFLFGQKNSPLISSNDKRISFGDLYIGQPAKREILLNNPTLKDVRLLRAYASCSCVGVSLSTTLMEAGKKASLIIETEDARPLEKKSTC